MDVVVDFQHVHGERGAVRWDAPVSFQIERGHTHLIRTNSELSAPLFRLCLGFSEPSHGSLSVAGKHPWTLDRTGVREFRRQLGCALEPDGLVANMTLKMNVVVPLVFATGLEYDEAVARADSMFNIMHLTMWADVRPSGVPIEVRQTAALARALASRPPVLLLENPLASVDNKETRRLLSLCRVQAETLLIATHRRDGILHEFADAVWEWDDEGFRVAA
ncbi:MAG TPA: ATP-binding cassette domain-containing protein [Gemmatimonadaceae bacterium]|nr:ATP-binding cassette domain-containing protein [Gemmatimonadaceae bacterium]